MKTVTIIGAGITGLSIGARLVGNKQQQFQVIILDKHKYLANETSSRNSEVLHAGIYYPPKSLKTRHCIRGKQLLYDILHKNMNNLPFKQCGKVIVSTSKEGPAKLQDIKDHARNVGVTDLRYLSERELELKVPFINKQLVNVALFSPSTGIFNSHSFIRHLEAQVLNGQGLIQLRNSVEDIEVIQQGRGGYKVKVYDEGQRERFTIDSDVVVNAAGLNADDLYSLVETDKSLLNDKQIHPCRGHYYKLRLPPAVAKGRLETLVYPVPDPNLKGLGIHLTIDLSGRIRVGPDADYIESKTDYRLDETKERFDKFWTAISRYLDLSQLENLPAEEKQKILKIDYVGIRPKLSSANNPAFRDFIVEMAPGLSGFVNCIGIESPGLTASLSIAEEVEQMLCK